MTTSYSFGLPCSYVRAQSLNRGPIHVKKSYVCNLHFASLKGKLSELIQLLYLLPTNLEKTKYWEARVDPVNDDNS